MRSTKASKIYSYNVIFEPMKEGGYSICFPDIPEICTFGETLEEARAMAKDALRCYLESAQKELGEMARSRPGAKLERLTIHI